VTDVGIEPRLVLAEHPAGSWPAFLRGWLDMGATHLCISTMGAGFTRVDDHLAALAAAREVHHAVVS